MREARDGRNYARRWERNLTDTLPVVPAAVRTYSKHGTLHCLAADFDVSRGGQAQVDTDAEKFAQLIAACGGRSFADISPTGGRHVYLPLAEPVGFTDARRIARALAARFPSLDPLPLLNITEGCIRPPGAAHRAGGHQQLTTPLPQALAAIDQPAGPQVWARLLDALAPQLAAVDADDHAGHFTGPLDDAPHVERPGGPAALGPEHEQMARTGRYDPARYRSPSEARQAVLAAAAARGHRLVDVARRVEHGTWPGLASFYARYRPPQRRKALVRDWLKAVSYAGSLESVRNSHTRGKEHRRGPVISAQTVTSGAGDYRDIRRWWTAMHAWERDHATSRGALSDRLILRSFAAAAQRRGTTDIDIGVRSHGLGSGLDHSTVAAHLRQLREQPGAPIQLLENDRGLQGDLYVLHIPEKYAEEAEQKKWRAGKFEAIHPVFRELGPVPALVYEQLTGADARSWDIAREAHVSRSACIDALQLLAAYGLAERTHDGWGRGHASLDAVADLLGITELVEALIDRYRVERAAWRAVYTGAPHTIADLFADLDNDLAAQPPSPEHDLPPPGPPPEPNEETPVGLLERILGAVVVDERLTAGRA